ncbi:uncharacterized protein BCR38DRAFT_426990 [Pseudomassariella vexata]|uniref:Uncharacterized protein n=1 Tax=Pseudomassariella vexata TaxID=1141098 RepID=A0A1Y2E7A7_9PEZI|nr:uncharacterized protein BCR38DRAFT_426990 [Pseudomassariella vexata]ORY67419.1 hypothetical protein BCR38DRAFT_426990 [Pseudomassariella vexata]
MVIIADAYLALNRGIAAQIGLASEAIKAYKQKEAPREQTDEEEWGLDEAQDELRSPSPAKSDAQARDASSLADSVIERIPPSVTSISSLNKLPHPVILPQRRPKDRSRGFIRAYAPDLMYAGIDQTAFIDFLNTFEKATRASPWLGAINLASAATLALPHGVGTGVAIAIQVVVGIAMELQSRKRSNTFLDKMNNEYFRPRGLYVLVMTYDTTSDKVLTEQSLTENIATSLKPKGRGHTIKDKFRVSNGKTAAIEFPATAELIFPALDRAIEAEGDPENPKKISSVKKAMEFINDYYDRRAQALYIAKNPNSPLAIQAPPPKFNSRFADPTHQSNNGSPISLITAGKIEFHPDPTARPHAENRGLKRILKKDVLYLTVVNMPSEKEMENALKMAAGEKGYQTPE